MRVGKTNQMISSSELRKLAKESGEKIYWDERVCEDASLEDIEEEKVKTFLKIAKEERNLRIGENIPTKEVLRKLKLKNGEPVRLK
jgi:ATP-dependent DNA helicase RecG